MKKLILIGLVLLVPGTIMGAYLHFMDEPYGGLSDNIVYEIIEHKGKIWTSTGRGVSFTSDGGRTWFNYDATNGLIYDEVTAIYSAGDTLWVAIDSAGVDNATKETYLVGQGLIHTEDEGQLWKSMAVEGTLGFRRTVYDIAGADSFLTFAAWAGGLGVSFNGGTTWRKVYYTPSDSVMYDSVLGGANLNLLPPTNLYFATVVDTFHQDSIVLWAGSADGLMRFVYAPDYAKPSSNRINYITSGEGYVYICGDSGLTSIKYIDSTEVLFSSFERNGLPGMNVTAAHRIGDYLLAGTLDTLGGEIPGLGRSEDNGMTFTTITAGLDNMDGAEENAEDFVTMGDFVFMAAFKAGLYKSADSGATWEAVPLTADPASLLNVAHSVDGYLDTLWVGTDTGVVLLTLDYAANAAILTDSLFEFTDSDTSGARCHKVRLQKYIDEDTEAVDSIAVWVIQHPLNPATGNYAVYFTPNVGEYWITNANYLQGAAHFDIEFFGAAVMLTGYEALRFAVDKIDPEWATIPGYDIRDSLGVIPNNYSQKNIYAIEAVDDTIYIGGAYGALVSPPGQFIRWHIFLADRDPRHVYAIDRYTVTDTLSGNFVNALDIQVVPDGDTLIWASTHPGATGGGSNGISVSTHDGKNWDVVYTGTNAWNFAFAGDKVFAATDAGLLMSTDLGESWDTLYIAGLLRNFPRPVDYFFDSATQVISVLVRDDTLWVGTDQGAALIHLDSLGNPDYDWDLFRTYDSTRTVYAFPVPYSPYDGDSRVFFHFPVPRDAFVTVEIFDFAMNLVQTVADGIFQQGGEGIVSSTLYWDGLNGKGDYAAAGIYYFKASLSTGEEYWGKLAVKP